MNKIMKVRVNGHSESPTRINLKSGEFEYIIDEPKQMGGTNQGASPVQTLLFALAGCLHVTGNFVASQMNMPIDELKIQIDGSLNPCKFMGISDKDRAGFLAIDVILEPKFKNKVSQQQINDWLRETERRCPVTDNIKEATKINIKI
jgi:uncharacterized OsmC-like protein